MSQIYKTSESNPPSGSILTLTGENDSGPNGPSGGNFNFSGSLSGGSSANGAVLFDTTADGEMNAAVQVDGTTISINASNELTALSGFAWTVTSSVSFTPSNRTGYILLGVSMATITLPVAATLDFWFAVADQSGNLFTIAQNAGDSILLGNDLTTTGATGSIVSTQTGSIASFVCYAAGPGASWITIWPQGSLQVN